MNQDEPNIETPTRELPDLALSADQAEEAKGGEIVPTDQPSLNFAKIRY